MHICGCGRTGSEPRIRVLVGGGNFGTDTCTASHNVECMWTHLLNRVIRRCLLRHTFFIGRLTVCSATRKEGVCRYVATWSITLVCTYGVFRVFQMSELKYCCLLAL